MVKIFLRLILFVDFVENDGDENLIIYIWIMERNLLDIVCEIWVLFGNEIIDNFSL